MEQPESQEKRHGVAGEVAWIRRGAVWSHKRNPAETQEGVANFLLACFLWDIKSSHISASKIKVKIQVC